ncbi:MAG: AI-2E family transporter [Verrucomicrobia bacterium]|nr:AI-2E family transporter [Verrucomicrobiota bacterium]
MQPTGPSERQAKILWFSVTALAVGVMLTLVALLAWGLGWVANRLSSVLLPLAIAGVLAFILDPLVDFFEPRLKSRLKSIWLVFALAVLVAGGMTAAILPRLISEVQSFTAQVPSYVTKVRERVDGFLKAPPAWLPSGWGLKPLPPATDLPKAGAEPQASPADSATPAPVPQPASASSETGLFQFGSDISGNVFSWTARAVPKVGSWLIDQLSKAVSVAGFLAGLALVPVYLFYFLLEKRGIQQRWHQFLPVRESQTKDEIVFVLSSINDCLVVFFRGQVLVAMCVGALLATGFSLIGLNYALLLGVMAGVLGIIPYLGVALSLVPALAIAIAQFGDPWRPAAVLGIFAIVQMLEGLVISPKIIGDRVGLHPLTVIIAVMIGTTLLGGILGGVLAIPLTAAFRSIMFRYVWRKQHEAAAQNTPIQA